MQLGGVSSIRVSGTIGALNPVLSSQLLLVGGVSSDLGDLLAAWSDIGVASVVRSVIAGVVVGWRHISRVATTRDVDGGRWPVARRNIGPASWGISPSSGGGAGCWFVIARGSRASAWSVSGSPRSWLVSRGSRASAWSVRGSPRSWFVIRGLRGRVSPGGGGSPRSRLVR